MNEEATENLKRLGEMPLGQDQLDRAHELACADPEALAQIAAMVERQGTRAEMVHLLEKLRTSGEARKLDAAARALCSALGNSDPNTAEKLLAIQVLQQKDQVDLLSRAVRQLGGIAKIGADKGDDCFFSGLVGGLVAGLIVK